LTIFDSNTATGKGGAIFYSKSDQNLDTTSTLLIQKNTFSQNTAEVGAVLFSDVNRYLPSLTKTNFLSLNLASSFGSPSAVYPYTMVAYYQNDFVSENSIASFPYSGPL